MQQTQKIIVAVVVTAIVVGGGVYFWQQQSVVPSRMNVVNPEQNQNTKQSSVPSDNQIAVPKVDQTSNWQVYKNNNFSYKCPSDWSLNTNKNYDGQVDLSECSKIYSGKLSFDDGVSLTFGFVPKDVAENYKYNGQKYSDTLFAEVKNEVNAQQYSNNNFSGWISMKNERHTLKMIARYQVSGGYYEISADAEGDTKTDKEFKKMIDDIVTTFQSTK